MEESHSREAFTVLENAIPDFGRSVRFDVFRFAFRIAA